MKALAAHRTAAPALIHDLRDALRRGHRNDTGIACAKLGALATSAEGILWQPAYCAEGQRLAARLAGRVRRVVRSVVESGALDPRGVR